MKPSLFSDALLIFLGYVRWTQLLPMVLAWGMLLLSSLAILFINFQEQSFSVLINLFENDQESPHRQWLTEKWSQLLATGKSEEGQGFQWTGDQIRKFILIIWGAISLLLFLCELCLRLIRRWRTGEMPSHQPQRQLRDKFLTCAAALLLVYGLLLAIFHFSDLGAEALPEFSETVFAVGIWVLLVGLVSAYSLTVTHYLQRISSHIEASEND